MTWVDEPRRNRGSLVAMAPFRIAMRRVVGHGAASSFPEADKSATSPRLPPCAETVVIRNSPLEFPRTSVGENR